MVYLLVGAAAVALLAAALLLARRRIARLDRLVRRLDRSTAREESLTALLDELSRLTAQLEGVTSLRRIPEILLEALERCFEPRQAVILIRRRPAVNRPDRQRFLMVAAAIPAAGMLRRTPVRIGSGDLGFVAQGRRVVGHDELRGRESSLPGFTPDLAAPMVVAGRPVGVMALSGAKRQLGHEDRVLALLAQIGAFSLQSVASYAEMKSVADTDALTGIFNRRGLNVRVEESLYEAQRKEAPVSILLFDIDAFKLYNDRHGHGAGDELLRLVASLARDQLRSDDILGRFGGDEFLLVLPGRPLAEALPLAEKLRRAIADFPFPHRREQPEGRLTVTVGVASFPEHGQTPTALVRRADQALYWGKERGKNRVVSAQDVAVAVSEPGPAERRGL